MEKILIIEDDEIIREELGILLSNNNYSVSSSIDFLDIEKTIENINPDLILLDINLPDTNGYEVIKKLKKVTLKPVIFVTSRNTIEDEIKSLNAGGYDFITKPYNKLILLEKIKRALNKNKSNKELFLYKGVTLDVFNSTLKYNDLEMELTRNEFRILYYFYL